VANRVDFRIDFRFDGSWECYRAVIDAIKGRARIIAFLKLAFQDATLRAVIKVLRGSDAGTRRGNLSRHCFLQRANPAGEFVSSAATFRYAKRKRQNACTE
jgi:hypothetical protein